MDNIAKRYKSGRLYHPTSLVMSKSEIRISSHEKPKTQITKPKQNTKHELETRKFVFCAFGVGLCL